MDLTLNDEQQLLVENVRELMQRENWEAYFAECDKSHQYPERWVKALCDLGFDLIMLPEEHGGGRVSLWISREIPMAFVFSGSRPPKLNERWMEALLQSSQRTGGMVVVSEEEAETRQPRN